MDNFMTQTWRSLLTIIDDWKEENIQMHQLVSFVPRTQSMTPTSMRYIALSPPLIHLTHISSTFPTYKTISKVMASIQPLHALRPIDSWMFRKHRSPIVPRALL